MSQKNYNKGPGKILQLQDKRFCIAFKSQPMLDKNKIMLYLCDEKYDLLKNEKGKNIILLKDVNVFF